MFYCDKCKSQRVNSTCKICGDETRKLWWSFGPDDNHKRSFKIWYKPDGSIDRESEIGES